MLHLNEIIDVGVDVDTGTDAAPDPARPAGGRATAC